MKLIEYTLVDKGMMPTTSGGIDAGYSERWAANIWYWLTEARSEHEALQLADSLGLPSFFATISGTRYLVAVPDGMDMDSISSPVFADIERRFHAEEPKAKLTLEQLGF